MNKYVPCSNMSKEEQKFNKSKKNRQRRDTRINVDAIDDDDFDNTAFEKIERR